MTKEVLKKYVENFTKNLKYSINYSMSKFFMEKVMSEFFSDSESSHFAGVWMLKKKIIYQFTDISQSNLSLWTFGLTDFWAQWHTEVAIRRSNSKPGALPGGLVQTDRKLWISNRPCSAQRMT